MSGRAQAKGGEGTAGRSVEKKAWEDLWKTALGTATDVRPGDAR